MGFQRAPRSCATPLNECPLDGGMDHYAGRSYHIVSATFFTPTMPFDACINKFSERISEMIADGWRPQGGFTFQLEGHLADIRYRKGEPGGTPDEWAVYMSQAMVKD